MRCPFCGNVDTQVKDSRPAEDNVAIRRRRFCPSCSGRFTTYERVQLRDLVVVKSNGKREDFVASDLQQVASLIGNFGRESKQIVEQVLEVVNAWPTYAAQAGVADALEDEVRRHLREFERLRF